MFCKVFVNSKTGFLDLNCFSNFYLSGKPTVCPWTSYLNFDIGHGKRIFNDIICSSHSLVFRDWEYLYPKSTAWACPWTSHFQGILLSKVLCYMPGNAAVPSYISEPQAGVGSWCAQSSSNKRVSVSVWGAGGDAWSFERSKFPASILILHFFGAQFFERLLLISNSLWPYLGCRRDGITFTWQTEKFGYPRSYDLLVLESKL